MFLVNKLISGRSESLGGGGLGGGWPCRLGIGLSGKRISVFGEFAAVGGVLGKDMPACMDGRGSLEIFMFAANESKDS
jgi:hypothetical protein